MDDKQKTEKTTATDSFECLGQCGLFPRAGKWHRLQKSSGKQKCGFSTHFQLVTLTPEGAKNVNRFIETEMLSTIVRAKI